MVIDMTHHHRKTGLAALWMTLQTGQHPLSLWTGEMGSKRAGVWATVWWLKESEGLTNPEVAQLLGVHRRGVAQMLMSLDMLAARHPEITAWMDSVTRTNRGAATTSPVHANPGEALHQSPLGLHPADTEPTSE